MSTVPLECSNCGATLPAEDHEARRDGTVKCPFCGSRTALPAVPTEIFPAEAPREASPVGPAAGASVRRKVPRPDSISVSSDMAGISLSYRWFSPVLFFLLFFCIAWDGFLVFWYAMALGGAAGGGPGGPFSWIMILFPIAHVAVGISLTYFVIAGFLNRTWIHVNREELRVAHGPVPWTGNWTLAVETIDQLYASLDRSNSENSHSYSVSVLLKEGRKVPLIRLLHNDEEARFIERTIEDFLGLEHYPVAGELAEKAPRHARIEQAVHHPSNNISAN